MKHADAEFDCIRRRLDDDLFSIQQNIAGIRLDVPREDFHQGAFSSAIFTQNTLDSTRFYL